MLEFNDLSAGFIVARSSPSRSDAMPIDFSLDPLATCLGTHVAAPDHGIVTKVADPFHAVILGLASLSIMEVHQIHKEYSASNDANENTFPSLPVLVEVSTALTLQGILFLQLLAPKENAKQAAMAASRYI